MTWIVLAVLAYLESLEPQGEIGDAVAVVYLAQKPGDRRPHVYEHVFEAPLPDLEETPEGLRIVGGGFEVDDGWIDG